MCHNIVPAVNRTVQLLDCQLPNVGIVWGCHQMAVPKQLQMMTLHCQEYATLGVHHTIDCQLITDIPPVGSNFYLQLLIHHY